MSAEKSVFSSTIKANEAIKPWLALGPMYEDVSATVQGLTLFERPGSTVGAECLAQAMEESLPLLAGGFHEGQETVWRGQRLHHELVRLPDRYLSYGKYFRSNTLCCMYMSTVVTAAKAGTARFRLTRFLSERVLVGLNGKVAFDSDWAEPVVEKNKSEWEFSMELAEGDNELGMLMYDIGRTSRVGFSLEPLDVELSAHVRPSAEVSLERRLQVEAELNSISLQRDIFRVGDTLGIELGVEPGGDLQVSLENERGEVVAQVNPKQAGFVTLAEAKELLLGSYTIRCVWHGPVRAIAATAFSVQNLELVPAPQGADAYEARRKALLTYVADHADPRLSDPTVQVARYALGRYEEIDEQALADNCDFIDARFDCADFMMNGLLRLMYMDREANRLSPAIKERIKSAVVGFKYWVDEPGDTVMWMDSENHRMLFHTAEWLAGQLYPTEIFTNSGLPGLYHATKGRMYLAEWIRQRGHYGFDEFHSNTYMAASIMPLTNVVDFALYEDHKLRQLAEGLIDYMAFSLAADSHKGVLGTPHGRSYGDPNKYPEIAPTSALTWLLYGRGYLTRMNSGAVAIATSRYRPPEMFYDIAHDDQATVTSHIRQGLLQGWQGEPMRDANIIVHRTPDYTIASMQDQLRTNNVTVHPAQATFDEGISLFWTCPSTSGEGGGLRPDYWGGSATLPRIIQHKNVMSLSWRMDKFNWMSHCWIERARFDEVRELGKWVVVRKGKGYAAIYSQHGYDNDGYGQYQGRELQCSAPQNVWLVECGREADWDNFDAFVQAVTTASVVCEGEKVTYHSPSIGTFVTGWIDRSSVEGEPLATRGYPLVDSAWAHSEFGSGEIRVRYHGEMYDIHLNL